MTLSRKRTGAALALIAIVVLAWSACTYCFLPKDTSTILWHAEMAFDQCSRGSPKAGDAFWLPTAAQVRAAEAALPGMLAARRKKGLRMPQKADGGVPFRFYHQYVGFTMKGERVLYLNAYPRYFDETMNDHYFRLFEQPEVTCDGGRFFWGVLYRPITNTFEQFELDAGGMDTPE